MGWISDIIINISAFRIKIGQKLIYLKNAIDLKANIDGSNIPPTTHWTNLHAGGLDGYVFHGGQVGNNFNSVFVEVSGGIFQTNKTGFKSWLGITEIAEKKEDAWIHSHRDFTDGTLIETDIDYSQTQGEEFLLEIKGNTYFDEIPLMASIQGYIYNGTLISCNGFSTLTTFNNILALNLHGKLHFWFPRLNYWQGFSVKVNAGFGGGGIDRGKQRCIAITNFVDPGGTKRVNIPIQIISTRNWTEAFFAKQAGYYPSLEVGKADNATKWNDLTMVDIQTNKAAYVMVSNGSGIWQYISLGDIRNVLGLQNYALLSQTYTQTQALSLFVGKTGVETIHDTKTFTHSPIVPNATLDGHPVNLRQFNLLKDYKIGGRNLAINSTSIDALPLYGVTGDYEVVNDPTLPSKKYFRLTNITRVAGDYVFYIPFGNLPLNYAYNLTNVPLTISFFIRTNNAQVLTGSGANANVNNVFQKVEFQTIWGGAGNAHFFLTGVGLSFMEIHSLKIEIGTKATDWTPSLEEQIPDFNQTDDTQFNYIKNKPTLSNFVSRLNINESIDGIKSFTGSYTEWCLNGDAIVNARGFAQSLSTEFAIGTLNNKPTAIYVSGSKVAKFGLSAAEFYTTVYTSQDGNSKEWDIAFKRGDFRDYGLGVTSGVPLPNLNADTLLSNGFYIVGSSWTGSPYPGVSGLNQGYLEHQSWGNNSYCLQKFVNVNSEIHNLFRIKDNGIWGNWIRLADRDFVNNAVANIPVHNGQLTVNTTADLVGGYVYLPSGNVTTTLGLATHILNAIADGQAAYNWGDHAAAGYTTLGAVQNWVTTQGFLTASALNGYVLQSSLTAQLANYATLAGTQTFTGQITFNQAPIVPNGSLGGHTVNLGQMQSYVNNAIANIPGQTPNRIYDPTDPVNNDYWDKIPIKSVRPDFGFDVCNYEPQTQEYVSIFSNYGAPYLNEGILGSIALMCPHTGVPVIKGTVECQINLNPYIDNNQIYFCLVYERDTSSPTYLTGSLQMLSIQDIVSHTGSGSVEMFNSIIVLGVATRDNTLMVQHREF